MSQRGHTLDDSWYLDYATGALAEEAYRTLLASHVELSGEARERVAALERVGAALLQSAEAAPGTLGFDAETIMARDDSADRGSEPQEAIDRAKHPASDDLPFPSALQEFLDRRRQSVRWGYLGPGLRKAILWRGETGERLWLLRAQPGMSIPHHGHKGAELTLVLKGSFWDADQQYRPGDVEEAYPGVEHDIRIDSDGECICLALTEGRLRFENPLLQAFQLFTGL